MTQQLVRMAEDVAKAERAKEELVTKAMSEKKSLLDERSALENRVKDLDSSREMAQSAKGVTAQLESQLKQVRYLSVSEWYFYDGYTNRPSKNVLSWRLL